MDATKKILIDARKLLIEKGWCQGTLAAFKDGSHTRPENPEAAAYCSMGAIQAAGQDAGYHGIIAARNTMRRAISRYSIAAWNDSQYRTKEEVIAAFDKAIEIESNRKF